MERVHKSQDMKAFALKGPLTAFAVILLFCRADVASECYQVKQEETCYKDLKDPYSLFATKTDYKTTTGLNGGKAEQFLVEGCEPVQLFLFSRHAARYPDKEEIIENQMSLPTLQSAILKAYDENRVHICKKDIKELKGWEYKFKPEFDNQVTKSGVKDTKRLGHRLQRMFPTLLPKSYSAKDYFIGFTSRVRTLQTAKAFLKEVLKSKDYDSVQYPQPIDDVLQFHKECDKILENHGIHKEKVEEVKKFEEGPQFQTLINSISWRLGINVTKGQIEDMARQCAFEYSMKQKSPWCAVFAEDDLKVLEFREDLDDYYKDAYGRERNFEQACPVIQQLVYRFKNGTSQTGPKGVLLFSHAGGFKKVVSRFGLRKDSSPLTAANYCSLKDNREWRSSLVSPFGANLVFVLFKCGETYKIQSFLNEKPVIVEGCKSSLCSFDEFLSTYGNVTSSCNLQQICSV